jgi:hypothetical protein
MQKKVSIWLILVLAAVLLISWSALAQEKAQHFDKVGSINFTIKSVAAGVGVSWGEGYLVFKDKTYPIKVKGFSIVTAGISSTFVIGDVFNLKDPADIEGEYKAFKAGAAVGAGLGRATAKNAKGVTLELAAQAKGVKFDLAAGNFTIMLK